MNQKSGKYLYIKLFALVTIFVFWTGCKKWKYNETTFRVFVYNACFGEPMKGARVLFFETRKSAGLGGVTNKTLYSEEQVTDATGMALFKNELLRKKSDYEYNVQYIRETTLPTFVHNETGQVTGDNSDEIINVYPEAEAYTKNMLENFTSEEIDSLYFRRHHKYLSCEMTNACFEGTILGEDIQYNHSFGLFRCYAGTWYMNWIVYANGQAYSYQDSVVMEWGGSYAFIYRL